MTDAGLTKVFYALGLGVAYVALNFVAITQQWPLGFALPSVVSFDLDGKQPREVISTMALYGAGLTSACMIPLLFTLIIHAKRYGYRSWAERVPVSETLGVEPSTPIGQTVQAAILVTLVLWPAYALGHALRKLFGTTAFCEQTPSLTVAGWSHFWPGPPPGCSRRWSIEGLLVYEPFVTPWAIAIIGGAVLATTLWALWLVFRPVSFWPS